MSDLIAGIGLVGLTSAGRRNIVICTTSIISGNRMMDSAIEKGLYAKDKPEDSS